MNALRFVYRNLDQFKSRYWAVFVVSIINGAAAFFIPVVLAEFTKSQFTFARLYTTTYILIGLYVATLLLSWFIRKYGESLGSHYENHIRFKYFTRLEQLSLTRLHEHHSGYILSLVNRIGSGASQLIFNIFWSFAAAIATFTLFFYYTARESVVLALLNFLLLMVFLAISTYFAAKMAVYNRDLNVKNSSLLESYADFLTNVITIKKLGLYDFAEQRLLRKTKVSFDQIYTGATYHAKRWFVLHILFGLAFIGTLVFLLVGIARGSVSASILILFIGAYASLRGTIERLSEVIKIASETGAYINTLEDLIRADTLHVGQSSVTEWQSIRASDVHFVHPGSSKIISVPEFTLGRHEKICIVGKSGEGKTTFLNILSGFLKPASGSLTIDTLPYEEATPLFFQTNFAIISQEVELFNLSLRDNLLLGQELSDEDLEAVLARVDLLDWSRKLERGLDTVIGEKGVKLSAGQKQRVNLLRGVLLQKEIYLLDEPTSHLDAATEARVIEYLQEVLAHKTVLIVSHQKPLRELCSRTYEFRDHALVPI